MLSTCDRWQLGTGTSVRTQRTMHLRRTLHVLAAAQTDGGARVLPSLWQWTKPTFLPTLLLRKPKRNVQRSCSRLKGRLQLRLRRLLVRSKKSLNGLKMSDWRCLRKIKPHRMQPNNSLQGFSELPTRMATTRCRREKSGRTLLKTAKTVTSCWAKASSGSHSLPPLIPTATASSPWLSSSRA